MNQTLAIAAGGAIGSLLRFWMATGVYAILGRSFPYGTLAVNVLGCLLMGVLYIVFVQRFSPESLLRAGILIGVLGGFTTFSSFSIETFNLIEAGATFRALLNIIASVFLCLGATWLGTILAKQF